MSGEDRGAEMSFVEARIPEPLWERIREVFIAERGYDPSTPQEALGVVCDLATAETTTDSTATGAQDPTFGTRSQSDSLDDTDSTDRAGSDSSGVDADPAAALGTAPQQTVDVIDEVFPERWDDQPFGERCLPPVLDEYVDCVEDGADDPEWTALNRVAERGNDDPETIRDGLVRCVYQSEPLPENVASEFFSEALEVASERLRDSRDRGESPTDIGDPDSFDVELAEHGGLSAETTFDGTPLESADIVADGDEVSFDQLVADLDATSEPIVPDGANVESLLDTSHTDSRVREVADEVLDEMTGNMFDELENGVDQGTGAGVADGKGPTEATSPSNRSSPGREDTNESSTDGDTNGDDSDAEPAAIPGPLSVNPETDCDRCGDTYQVSDLQTVLSNDDGSALLLCPDCQS